VAFFIEQSWEPSVMIKSHSRLLAGAPRRLEGSAPSELLGDRPASPAKQKATRFEALNFVPLGAMPLPFYLTIHPSAKATSADLEVLRAYLHPPENSAGATRRRQSSFSRLVATRDPRNA
jgi:hypothetical protein